MLLKPARSTVWLTALVALSLAMGDVAFAAKPKGRVKEKEKKERKAKVEKPEKFERVEKFDSAPIPDSVLTPEEPEPIDKLQEKLYRLRKSKKAHALKKAYDALMEQRFSKAQALAQPFQGDEIYGDYGLWISESALRKEAEKAFEKKQYDQAQASAQKALYLALQIEARDPYSPLAKHVPKDAGMAELILGSVQWAKKNHAEAQRLFNKGFQRLSTVGTFEEVRPELLQRYGESCARHKTDLCLSWVQRFLSLYPKNAVEMKAMARGLPEVLERARLPRPVSKLTQTYRTQEADQIAFDAAMTLYLAGEHRDAIDKFKAFFEEFPKSSFRFRARYWLAQALNKRSDEDKAKAELEQLYKDSPLTYYGLLASVDTSRVVESAIDPSKPMAAETDPFLLPNEIRRLRRAQSFIVEGAYDLASIELRDVKPRDALSSHFLMYLAMLCHEARNYNSSFQILSQLAQRGFEGMTTTFVIGMIFPTPFFDLIRKYATRNELDPILVLSLIKQESAFTPNIGSSAGAVGLMQIMPATAVEVDPDIRRADLLDPESNIRTGTKYLRWLLNKFNGNMALALAGYNAGPYATERWIRAAPEKRGMLEFIETIPYKETREYVAGIIRNYYWYSRRLTSDVPKTIAYFWNPNAGMNLGKSQNDPIAPLLPGPGDSVFVPGAKGGATRKPARPDGEFGPGAEPEMVQ